MWWPNPGFQRLKIKLINVPSSPVRVLSIKVKIEWGAAEAILTGIKVGGFLAEAILTGIKKLVASWLRRFLQV